MSFAIGARKWGNWPEDGLPPDPTRTHHQSGKREVLGVTGQTLEGTTGDKSQEPTAPGSVYSIVKLAVWTQADPLCRQLTPYTGSRLFGVERTPLSVRGKMIADVSFGS